MPSSIGSIANIQISNRGYPHLTSSKDCNIVQDEDLSHLYARSYHYIEFLWNYPKRYKDSFGIDSKKWHHLTVS